MRSNAFHFDVAYGRYCNLSCIRADIANSLQRFRAVACSDFEIIEYKTRNFVVTDRQTDIHGHGMELSIVTLRPRGEGKMMCGNCYHQV